jgi:glycosyltransferase involved in cell wall biosynthesis
VLTQTFQGFELIIVDDASTDGTGGVARSFQRADPRVHYLKHMENQGASAARNTGIAIAKGEFIAFLDDDDEWLPSKLDEQLAVFRSSSVENLGLVYCGAILVDAATGKELGWMPATKRGNLVGELLKGNCISGGGSTAVVRRQVFDQCGTFDTAALLALGPSEDWDMWLRIAHTFGFDFASEFLVRYSSRLGANRTARDLAWADHARAHEYIMQKQDGLLQQYRCSASTNLHDVGYLYLLGGMGARGRQRFLEALRWNPANIKAWVSLGLSLFGPTFYQWAYATYHRLSGRPIEG